MKILQSNCDKADTEVQRLDDIVEKIRQVCQINFVLIYMYIILVSKVRYVTGQLTSILTLKYFQMCIDTQCQSTHPEVLRIVRFIDGHDETVFKRTKAPFL